MLLAMIKFISMDINRLFGQVHEIFVFVEKRGNRRSRLAYTGVQSRQNFDCLHSQCMEVEEGSKKTICL